MMISWWKYSFLHFKFNAQQSNHRTGLCAFKNHQKVDALVDQVCLFAKVRTAISSKHAKTHLFDFSCLAGAQNAPTQQNHFKTTFGDPLSALMTQRSFRFSKRSKIQIPLMVPFKRAPKKSRPGGSLILTRPDRSLMGGGSFPSFAGN